MPESAAFFSPKTYPRFNDPESLREQILRVLLYFDVFHHPLTWFEVRDLAMAPDVPDEAVRRALRILIDQEIIEEKEGYYHIKGREGGVAKRRVLEESSRLLWNRVGIVCRLLAHIPYVRGVSVTGTLAKDVAGPDADIDLIVFTKRDRVWICRTTIAVIRRLLPRRLRRLCCANIFLAEHALCYDQRTMYVAVEIASSRPVFNHLLGEAFIQENEWIRAFLPGISKAKPGPLPALRMNPAAFRWVEWVFDGALGDRLEVELSRSWSAFWAYRYKHLEAGKRARLFRIDREVSTNHLNDFQTRTLETYAKRLSAFGLELMPCSTL